MANTRLTHKYKIRSDIIKKLNVVSLFSGIGAFEEGLYRNDIDYNLLGYSEIDDGYGKAVQEVYEELHNAKGKYLGLVQSIRGSDFKNVDLITHGSPCQDFSIAGDRKGGDKGSNTQSSLMWETVRIINESLPKYVIWENVKSVLFKSNIHNFEMYLEKMEKMGYHNYHKVLSANDFGVPQKRERIFVISVRGESNFQFPTYNINNVTLRDILEDNVSDGYSVPVSMIDGWYNKKPPFGDRFNLLKYDDIGYTLVAKGGRAVITNNYILKHESDYQKIEHFKGKTCLRELLDKNIEIRALTPREYWRMMGWDEESINKVYSMGVSDARMYKMAGNSIVVNILEQLFKCLLKN